MWTVAAISFWWTRSPSRLAWSEKSLSVRSLITSQLLRADYYLHSWQVSQPNSPPHTEAPRQGQGRVVQRRHKVAGSRPKPCWWCTSIQSPCSQTNQPTCSSARHTQQHQLTTLHTNFTRQVWCTLSLLLCLHTQHLLNVHFTGSSA